MTLEIQKIQSIFPNLTVETLGLGTFSFSGFTTIDAGSSLISNLSTLTANSLQSGELRSTNNLAINSLAPGSALSFSGFSSVDTGGATFSNLTVSTTTLQTEDVISPSNLDFQSLTPGSTVNFSNFSVINGGGSSLSNLSALASSSLQTDQITSPVNLSISSATPGSTIDFSGFSTINAGGSSFSNVSSISLNSLQTNEIISLGDLSINPTGNVLFNNKSISGVLTFQASEIFLAADLRLRRTGSAGNPVLLVDNGLGGPATVSANALTSSSVTTGTVSATTSMSTNSLAVRSGSNSAGVVATVGSRADTAVTSTTPTSLDLGTGLAPSAAGFSLADQKLLIYSRNNGDFAGFGFNNDGVLSSNLTGPVGFQWHWNYGGGNRMSLTSAGDLSVFSTMGAPVVNAPTRLTTPLITSASNVDLSINSGNRILMTTTGNWRGIRMSNTNSNSFMWHLPTTTLPGWHSFGVNMDYNDASQITRFNTSKRWWRQIWSQNSTADNFLFQSGTNANGTGDAHISIDPSVTSAVQFPSGVRTSTIDTASGDLSINPSGTNVNFNNKTIVNANITANTISATTSVTTPLLTSAAGNLSINSAGSAIAFNTKNLIDVNNLLMGSALSTVGNLSQKLQLYRVGGGLSYGFGVQTGVLSYETPTASDSHVFYSAQTERVRINDAGLRLAVPITTASGDLSINPAGSNINFNNKNIINANIGGTNSGDITGITDPNWSGSITARLSRIGNHIILRLSGTVVALGDTSSFSNTLSGLLLPSGFRPTDSSTFAIFASGTFSEPLRLRVQSSGDFSIQREDQSNIWIAGQSIDVISYVSYFA